MLIDLSKSELKKIEYYLLGDTDPLVVSILEKIRNLDDVCECEVKQMKILFNIREFLWVCVSEVEDWLYPYRDRLTPEERFEIRVKDPMSGENFMVEEHIQQQNERIERLQDEMITVQMKLAEHEERFKTKVKIKKGSTSVSGEIKNIFNS